MLSPAQRHKQRVELARRLAANQPANAAHSLHTQLRALERDIESLRDLPMTADRVAMKRDVLLPRWLPTVRAYLTEGQIYQNLVFSWCVIWLFDVGDFDQALDWADIAIEQGQETPERINRKFPAFVADTILEWATIAAESGESLEPYFSRTLTNVTEKWRLHEEITAKWLKFAGLLLLRDAQGLPRATAVDDVATLRDADRLLASAEGFYKNIGVTTMRRQIAARIRQIEKRGQ